MMLLEIGKLIEKKGLETLVVTAVAVVVFSAWVFYGYAWRAVSQSANPYMGTSLTEESLIKNVEADLNSRAADLKELKEKPLVAPDIFK